MPGVSYTCAAVYPVAVFLDLPVLHVPAPASPKSHENCEPSMSVGWVTPLAHVNGEAVPVLVVLTASKNTASGATPEVRWAVVIAAPDGGGLAATVIAADAVFDVSAALTPTTVYVPAVAGAV